LLGEFERVADQVDDDLPELFRVGDNGGDAGRQIGHQLHRFVPDQPFLLSEGFAHQLVERDQPRLQFDLPGLDL
jgi:hypothetical protein